MSEAFECDICSDVEPGYPARRLLLLGPEELGEGMEYDELCEECDDELREFLEQKSS